MDSSIPVTPDLQINETVDGVKVKKKRAARKVAAAASAVAGAKTQVKTDPWLWGIYLTLLVVSVIELYSASSTMVTLENVYTPLIRHMKYLAIGFVTLIFFQHLHYKWFRKYAWAAAVISLGLLVYSFYFGEIINNAQRSINFGGISLQPAELVKLTVMVVLAYVLAKNQKTKGVTMKGIVISTVIIGVFAGLTFRNGLTNTVLLMGVALSMMLIGGIQWKPFLCVLVVYGCIGGVLMMSKSGKEENEFNSVGAQTTAVVQQANDVDRSDTRKKRITDFFAGVSPNDKITDQNRQVMYSKFSQANGGLIGCGPGNNRESARLPLAYSDYIFSIIVEDTGLLGGVLLIFLYLGLLGRAGFIASKCSRAFPALLIMGCAVLIVFQALIHMAIVTGLVPVSGQPLPFISMGGTSIWVMSMALGMMLSVSRSAVKGKDRKQVRDELKDLPEDIHTVNPSQIA